MSYTFGRNERLKSKKLMASLFKEGSFLVSGSVQLKYLSVQEDQEFPIQAAFTVPKSKFKRAVDRNLLKRRMRSIYRLNKHNTYARLAALDKKMALIFIYGSTQLKEQKDLEQDMLTLLNKMCVRLEK